jgi:hypothetical protein
MNAVAVPKSARQNWLEGIALCALYQGFPTFTGAVLLLKLFGSGNPIVAQPGGAVFFVAVTSLLYALTIPWLARKFPRLVKTSYEPLFFDPSLSFSEKLLRWRTQPAASMQLLTLVLMLSALALAVVAVG